MISGKMSFAEDILCAESVILSCLCVCVWLASKSTVDSKQSARFARNQRTSKRYEHDTIRKAPFACTQQLRFNKKRESCQRLELC